MTTEAIVLFAHGSRDPAWKLPIERIAESVRAKSSKKVYCAYLEFCAPDLVDALNTAVGEGARDIAIWPLFLAAGGHLKNDVPPMIRLFCAKHVDTKVTLMPTLGDSDELREAISTTIAFFDRDLSTVSGRVQD